MTDRDVAAGGFGEGSVEAARLDPETGARRNRIWFDTEFIEDGTTVELISIGMVREDGAEYYAQSANCDLSRASPWVKDNVLPHLGTAWKTRQLIAAEIIQFAGETPEFWAYYADYDWVALCQLYGTMMDLPEGWPMFCLDLKQSAYELGNPPLRKQDGTEHHALADARWTRDAWLDLRSLATAAAVSGDDGRATPILSQTPPDPSPDRRST